MAVQTGNDRSVSDLVQQLSAQTGELVRQELRLAQVDEAMPLAPKQAIETTKQDIDYVKARASG